MTISKKKTSASRKKAPTKPAKKAVAKSPVTTVDEMHAFLSQGREGVVTYMLRSCAADMSAYNGFKWPEAGAVKCPDWSSKATCGNGLHGLLMGKGSAELTARDDPAAKWLVCAIWSADVVDLDTKIKVPRAWVTLCGTRDQAVVEIQRLGGSECIYGTATAGAYGTATAGEYGTATAGYGGTATAGAYGTATAGYGGTATAGAYGTATAGEYGTATAGVEGMICIKRWNGKRFRMHVAYVGEEGIEPNVPYKLDNDGAFVRAKVAP